MQRVQQRSTPPLRARVQPRPLAARFTAPRNLAGASPWTQEVKKLRGKRPSDPEPQAVGLDEGRAPAPAGRAEVDRTVVPATAAEDAGRTIAARSPRRAVCRRSVIVGVITILDPFRNITVHIVKAQYALAANDPTGAVLPSHSLPQPRQLALPLPISLPHEYDVFVPARAAYSHSASESRR